MTNIIYVCTYVYIISYDKSSPFCVMLGFLQPCKDMQDIEFTIQQGKLYMLQTRTGKTNRPCCRADRSGFGPGGFLAKDGPSDLMTGLSEF